MQCSAVTQKLTITFSLQSVLAIIHILLQPLNACVLQIISLKFCVCSSRIQINFGIHSLRSSSIPGEGALIQAEEVLSIITQLHVSSFGAISIQLTAVHHLERVNTWEEKVNTDYHITLTILHFLYNPKDMLIKQNIFQSSFSTQNQTFT